jgi:aldehyde dehydrogenase (NAD+)
MCTTAKALSIGNLKQVWTNEGRAFNFFAPPQSRWFLEHSHQVKNIWVPYGE